MDNTAQWIPLSGPGGRLPTEADADDNGYVMILFNDSCFGRRHLMCVSPQGNQTHFCPIPKAPPLPKPVEITPEEQVGIDYKHWAILVNRSITPDGLAAYRRGTLAGRAQLAREALGLFDNSEALYQTANKLHALLTKAAGENK